MNAKPDVRGATTSLDQTQMTLPTRMFPETHRNWARNLTLEQNVDTISSTTAASRAVQHPWPTQVLDDVCAWGVDVRHGAVVAAGTGLEQLGGTA